MTYSNDFERTRSGDHQKGRFKKQKMSKLGGNIIRHDVGSPRSLELPKTERRNISSGCVIPTAISFTARDGAAKGGEPPGVPVTEID